VTMKYAKVEFPGHISELITVTLMIKEIAHKTFVKYHVRVIAICIRYQASNHTNIIIFRSMSTSCIFQWKHIIPT
jgi:hypothetical protein